MGQKRKRNHWVPQSYLRAFAADPERREKIWRFSKQRGDPALKPIENVAMRFYLYAPKDRTGTRDYSFEEKLSDLENWFGHPLWRQVCDDMVDLQWKPLRKMVALLTATMYLRNPAQLESMTALHRQMASWIAQSTELPSAFEHKGKTYSLDPSSWPAYRDASEEDIKRDWTRHVGSAVWLAELLMKMRWSVLFSDQPVFITTDNPVAVLHPSLTFKGLRNPETSVTFPLSPTRVLIMDNRHCEPDGHYYPVHDPASINMLLWREANEYMFSHRHPDLVCAEMLEEARQSGYA